MHTVENLHLRRAARDRAQEPGSPRTRFFDKTCTRQCEKREGRIAQPAEAIIPVAYTADFFRQRRRRRRDDAASGLVGKAFKNDERPHDSVAPFAAILAASSPVSPIFLGVPPRLFP